MNESGVRFKNEAIANKTVTWPAGSIVSKPFDWDSTLKLKPDPFFDTSRWIGTIGGREVAIETSRPAQDESQIALSVVERAIGGKLVDKKVSTRSPSASHPKSGKAAGKKSSRP